MPSFRFCLLLGSVNLAALACGAAFVAGLGKTEANAAGLLPSRLQHLDALLQAAVERQQIAGGVLLLARRGRIGRLQAIGWRDREARTAMTPDTLFRIASLTKPITSVAVMMLVEDGKLRLNDPVSKYVPEFKNPRVLAPSFLIGGPAFAWSSSASREITIHDLLTHTSGLSYRFLARPTLSALYREGGVSDGLVHPRCSSADNVRRLAKQPLLFPPGSAWEYGLSTDVLGVVVEAVSGQDLDSFFRERIFGPLKMDDTFFLVPQAKRDRLATLYLRSAGKLRRVGEEPVMRGELALCASYPCESDGKYFSGGSGLVSTASDYARFLQMLLGGGELDGVRLLRAETVQCMTRNQLGARTTYLPEFGDGFGYGFAVRTQAGSVWDVASAGSYSWVGAFNTYFWVDPKEELIGVLMTQVLIDDLPLRYELKKRVYQCLAD
ncbi:MAG TPA: serine hydrolase domain-containing protein [Gemmataceae bacterium]|nr:serine hydrolase domain-containing protein [Gemmataceae bacterium]